MGKNSKRSHRANPSEDMEVRRHALRYIEAMQARAVERDQRVRAEETAAARRDPLCGVFVAVHRPADLGPLALTLPATAAAMEANPEQFAGSLQYTPVGYKMVEKKFEEFMASLEAWAGERRVVAVARNCRDSRTKVEKAARKARRAEKEFKARFGSLAERLWVTAPWRGSRRSMAPHFNPIYFPRSGAGKLAFFRLVDAVSSLYLIAKGDSRGAPGGSKHFTPNQKDRIQKLGRKGMSSEKITATIWPNPHDGEVEHLVARVKRERRRSS